MEDTGGRDGLRIRRWRFLGRPAYEPSSSSCITRDLREMCMKSSKASQKLVICLDLRELGWVA
ncbi:hypothetical protein ACE6H2_022233 [Prunus campanulata]